MCVHACACMCVCVRVMSCIAAIGGDDNDASLLDSSLTFTFGDTEDCLSFTVTDDSITESTEFFIVNVPNVGTGLVTIFDNDGELEKGH